MQNLFLTVLVLLVAFSQFMTLRANRSDNKVPHLLWATGAHKSRTHTAELFQNWLKENHYPEFVFDLDSANAGPKKSLIQGVTGVASDVIDNLSGTDVHFFQQIGLLEDITDLWKDAGQTSDNYYPENSDDCFVDGRRYSYSGNAGVSMLVINRDTFKKQGMAPPPYRMDVDSFEKIGREFTAKANQNEKVQKYFFLDSLNAMHLRRTMGVSYFNETLTRAALNRRETVEAMKRVKKWTYVDHLIPTKSEVSSFNVDAGVGSASFQLFYHSQIAMLYTGRWVLMQLRDMGPGLNLTVCEPPNAGYPTSFLSSRQIGLYKGSRQKDLAKTFFLFLSSQNYSRYIIECGDSMPPNPRYLDDEALLRPSGHTNEWEFQQNFVKGFKTIGQGREYSPYAATALYLAQENKINDAFMSGVITAEEAALQMDETVNTEITRHIRSHPELLERYQAALVRQKTIDALKAAGKKIPADLVENSFLKRYYADTGKLEK